MSDDIVTRLRNWHDQRDSWQVLTEAADEIERLRKNLKELQATISIMKRTQQTQTKIVQKLRQK